MFEASPDHTAISLRISDADNNVPNFGPIRESVHAYPGRDGRAHAKPDEARGGGCSREDHVQMDHVSAEPTQVGAEPASRPGHPKRKGRPDPSLQACAQTIPNRLGITFRTGEVNSTTASQKPPPVGTGLTFLTRDRSHRGDQSGDGHHRPETHDERSPG